MSPLKSYRLHNITAAQQGLSTGQIKLTAEWDKGLLFALHAPPQDSKRGACWKWSFWVLKPQDAFLRIEVLVNVGMSVEIEHFVGTSLNLRTFTTKQCSKTTLTILLRYGWLTRSSDLKAIQ
jgi:hypothetical protein